MDYENYFNRNTDSEQDFSSWGNFLGEKTPDYYGSFIKNTCAEIIKIKEEIKSDSNFSYVDYIMNNAASFLKAYRESSENTENNILDILRNSSKTISIDHILTFKEIYNNLYTSDKSNPYDLFKNKKKKDIINFHYFLLNNNKISTFLNKNNLNLSEFIKDTETFYLKYKHYSSSIVFLNQQYHKGLSVSHASSLLKHCNLSAYAEYISLPLFKELIMHGYDFEKNKTYAIAKKTASNNVNYSLSFEQKKGSKNPELLNFMTICAIKNSTLAKYIIKNQFFNNSIIEITLNIIRHKKFNISIDMLNTYEKLYLNNTLEKNTIRNKIARL